MSQPLGMVAALPAESTLRADVQQKLRVEALKRSLAGGETQEKKLRDACQGFESVFLSKLFSEMRSTIPKDGLLRGQYEDQYYSMFDKALCDKMSASGGIGLADMMYRQLRSRVLGQGNGKAVPGDVLPANRSLAAHPAADTLPVSGQGLPSHLGTVPYQMLSPGAGLAPSHVPDPAAGQAAAAAQAAKDMAAPAVGRITSEYGWRTDPFRGGEAWHAGLDIAAAEGDPVQACWAGTVVFAGVKGGYGNMVEVEHPGGWTSIYGHLRSFSVREGDQVAAGGKIAEVGSTGRATGPHLHFELHHGQETVNPETVLAQAGLVQDQR